MHAPLHLSKIIIAFRKISLAVTMDTMEEIVPAVPTSRKPPGKPEVIVSYYAVVFKLTLTFFFNKVTAFANREWPLGNLL